jgi:aspartate kinase
MLVLKFGGTSVEDARAIERVCEIVRSRAGGGAEQRTPTVVVVSALAGVTDQLVQMGTLAEKGDIAEASRLCRQWAVRHLRVVRSLLPRKAAARAASEMLIRFQQLEAVIDGVAAVRELSARTTDRLLAFGELASSAILASALASRNLKAELVDARDVIVTDRNHTRALPDFNVTNARMQARVKPLAKSGAVVVLGGFVGATPEGVTTTLGRGGSDFSATIVGAALGAKRIEIWTDVDGVMTADPKLCHAARTIEQLSFEEAAELAHFGAKVIHPWSMVPARDRGIPVWVLNSRNPQAPPTIIRNCAPDEGFKGIAVKRGVTVVEIAAERRLASGGFLKTVFDALDRHGCGADVVATTDLSVSVSTVHKNAIAGLAAELEPLARVRHENSKAIVSLVGHNSARLLAHVYSALSDVPVRLSAQGASRLTLSFVLDEKDVNAAVRKLHRAVFEKQDAAVA